MKSVIRKCLLLFFMWIWRSCRYIACEQAAVTLLGEAKSHLFIQHEIERALVGNLVIFYLKSRQAQPWFGQQIVMTCFRWKCHDFFILFFSAYCFSVYYYELCFYKFTDRLTESSLLWKKKKLHVLLLYSEDFIYEVTRGGKLWCRVGLH